MDQGLSPIYHPFMWGHAGGQREGKMLTELRRPLKTEEREGQLPIINESVYYRVTYSEGGIGLGGGGEENDLEECGICSCILHRQGAIGTIL